MKVVRLGLSSEKNAHRAGRALQVSQWLQKEYGLVRDKDYDWYFMSVDKEVHFRFFAEDSDQMESLMHLLWAE